MTLFSKVLVAMGLLTSFCALQVNAATSVSISDDRRFYVACGDDLATSDWYAMSACKTGDCSVPFHWWNSQKVAFIYGDDNTIWVGNDHASMENAIKNALNTCIANGSPNCRKVGVGQCD